MTKTEFDRLFKKYLIEYNTRDPKVMKEKIEKFKDKDGKINSTQLTLFVLQESIEYTNKMLYSLLLDIVVKDEDKEHNC